MLKCGFSRVCITPPMGAPIAGGFKPKYATHVLDDLFARAIAFSDGETRAVIISVDVCYLSNEINDECRTRIAKECGIKYSRTVIDAPDFALQNNLMEFKATCHHRA